jgi:prevent-host-death family protein
MHRIIGVTELQRRFRTIFDEVSHRHVPYVLTRGSRPEATLIPYEDFLRFQEMQEKEELVRFDRLLASMAAQNTAYDEDEVADDVAAAQVKREG